MNPITAIYPVFMTMLATASELYTLFLSIGYIICLTLLLAKLFDLLLVIIQLWRHGDSFYEELVSVLQNNAGNRNTRLLSYNEIRVGFEEVGIHWSYISSWINRACPRSPTFLSRNTVLDFLFKCIAFLYSWLILMLITSIIIFWLPNNLAKTILLILLGFGTIIILLSNLISRAQLGFFDNARPSRRINEDDDALIRQPHIIQRILKLTLVYSAITIVAFTTIYLSLLPDHETTFICKDQIESYDHHWRSKIAGLAYSSTSIFTTTGFGDICPKSALLKFIVLMEMGCALTLIVGLLSAMTSSLDPDRELQV